MNGDAIILTPRAQQLLIVLTALGPRRASDGRSGRPLGSLPPSGPASAPGLRPARPQGPGPWEPRSPVAPARGRRHPRTDRAVRPDDLRGAQPQAPQRTLGCAARARAVPSHDP